jgi:adenylate kinase
MNIILMGPVGSGKTTQAEILSKKLGLPHIQTGEIYRKIATENSDIGKKIKTILDAGDLIDDETTFEVIDKHLKEIPGGFVIDGFPRTLIQAKKEIFGVDKVFYIKISDEEALKRLLLRKRDDDTPEVIVERLKVYHQETEPILDYFRNQGKLVEIDGNGTVEEVYDRIKNS